MELLFFAPSGSAGQEFGSAVEKFDASATWRRDSNGCVWVLVSVPGFAHYHAVGDAAQALGLRLASPRLSDAEVDRRRREEALCLELAEALEPERLAQPRHESGREAGREPWYELREGTLRVWTGSRYASGSHIPRSRIEEIESLHGFWVARYGHVR
jgi:hypothetical protein